MGTMSGAAEFLQELPSQGYFSSSQPSSNPADSHIQTKQSLCEEIKSLTSWFWTNMPNINTNAQGGLRVYICDHETAPPEEQLIRTDSTNILIRYLTLKKGKSDQKSKDNKRKADDTNGKRPAERSCDDKAMTKRINVGGGPSNSRRDASSSRLSDKELQGFTVQKIKILLKERGQPLKGNKDELIARLKKSFS